jgi:hypothetical protein
MNADIEDCVQRVPGADAGPDASPDMFFTPSTWLLKDLPGFAKCDAADYDRVIGAPICP